MVKSCSFMTQLLSLFLFLLLLIIAALQLEATVIKNTFHCVHEKKNCSDAQQYCKEKFTGLASPGGHREDLLNEIKKNRGGWSSAWIGLYRDPGNASAWRWTGERGDASSDTNWATGQPEIRSGGEPYHRNCGAALYYFKWFSTYCFVPRPFICVAYNVILVKENKTWEEALEHCRAIGSDDSSQHNHYRDHQYDLVSLQSEDDHRYARDKIQEATANEVWTALRFLAGQWLWVDGEPQQYQDLPLCPAWGRHCGTLPKDNSTQWQIRDCMEKLFPFTSNIARHITECTNKPCVKL